MPLREEFESQGNWLFRWRSYLPLVLLPLFAFALFDAGFSKQPAGSWDSLCVAISALGLFVRIMVAGFVPGGTSGRNVARQEASALNQTGIYSTVRHPLYLGNYLMTLGVVFFIRSPWFALVFSLAYWLYYERIMFAEEEFLRKKYKKHYEKWASNTSAIIPCFNKYKTPALGFSTRTVLRREYPGLFGMIFSFTLLASVRSWLSSNDPNPGKGWMLFFLTGAMVYVLLRSLKRYTSLLSVKGR